MKDEFERFDTAQPACYNQNTVSANSNLKRGVSAMVKTINLQLDVPIDRKIHFTLPPDVPTGFLEAVLVIVPSALSPKTAPTDSALPALDDLLHAEFFGMWQDRTDIDDSAAFAQHLRTKAWSRPL